jgi:serine/threonine protein kinase
MAELWEASDRELDRQVAIKVLSDRFAEDREIRSRFERESRTACQISQHPHIVTIFDVGEWRGRPYIVMELLRGGTLADRISAGTVPPAQALEWLAQAAAGLDAAHATGIVHRDVKPSNLLLDDRGDLRVVDFGVARAANGPQAADTMPGTVLGTAGYLSPEQARGEPATPASDIYSLGLVARELLGVALRGVPTGAVARVLERALSANPPSRPASAGELVSSLDAALQAEQPTAVVEPTARPRARRRIPLAAAATLALLAGGVVAAIALSPGGSEPAAGPAPPAAAAETTRNTRRTMTTRPAQTTATGQVLQATKTKGKSSGKAKRKGKEKKEKKHKGHVRAKEKAKRHGHG